MNCPVCGSKTIVTRTFKNDQRIDRKRRCTNSDCSFSFDTNESLKQPIIVVKKKKDGKRENFDVKKLRLSIEKAFVKLPNIPPETIDEVVARVNSKLIAIAGSERIVTHQQIGREVLKELNKISAEATIRFASYYSADGELSLFEEMRGPLKRWIEQLD